MDAEYKLQKLETLIEKDYFDINKKVFGVKFNFLRGIAKARDDWEITKSEKLELFKDYLWIKRYEGYYLGSMKELLNEGFKLRIDYELSLKN